MTVKEGDFLDIYMDNSATTKVYDEVADEMFLYLKTHYANPSSVHRMGLEVEKKLKGARKRMANLIGANEKEIVFTSGGTESDNMAIRGVVKANKRAGKHIITTSIEHPAVLNTVKELEEEGYEVTYLKPDENGVVSFDSFKSSLREDTVLAAIMHVNNETGSVQPIEKIGKYLSRKKGSKTYFFVDAVQSFGKIDFKPSKYGIDLMSVSSHKIHGPKGAGILYIKEGTKIRPMITGGGQEMGIRSGTENIPGIMGFVMAAERAVDNIKGNVEKISRLKDMLRFEIEKNIDDIKVNSPEDGACHVLNVSFLGVRGEVLLHSLEQDGVYVSTGSACSSKKKGSHVLLEMGLSPKELDGAIRFSLSGMNDESQILAGAKMVQKHVEEYRKIVKR